MKVSPTMALLAFCQFNEIMDIYFILHIIIKYNFIFLLKLFHCLAFGTSLGWLL